jgi:hypothetical protein
VYQGTEKEILYKKLNIFRTTSASSGIQKLTFFLENSFSFLSFFVKPPSDTPLRKFRGEGGG